MKSLGYARTALSRTGALSASVAFVTLGEMLTIGCQAETDMLFTFLSASALLLWHWGTVEEWPEWVTWTSSYAFVGLGLLCKGPQTPLYFALAVGGYSLVMGQWRRLFSRAHLGGIAVFLVVVGLWMVPYAVRTSLADTWLILTNNTTDRLIKWTFSDVALHLVQFPIETLGTTLPWSLVLLGLLSPDVRRAVRVLAWRQAVYVGLAFILAFPSCWLPPGGRTRYFAPLYPCLAVMVGILIECSMRADATRWMRTAWWRYATSMAGIMVVATLGLLLSPLVSASHVRLGALSSPAVRSLPYAAMALAMAVLTFWGRQAGNPVRMRGVILGITGFMVLFCTGYMTDVRIRRSEDHAAAMVRLKGLLPANHRLVSLGRVNALFVYHYGKTIPAVTAETMPSGEDLYFCVALENGQLPEMPFAWEEVTTISPKRFQGHGSGTLWTMLIGRVIAPEIARTNQPSDQLGASDQRGAP